MKFLKEKLLLSEKGYSDLKKAIVACTLTNIALLLPAGVTTLLFWQLLNPFYGKDISWGNMWGLLIVGIIASLLVFLAARNDYRKTYLASYKEASNTRLRIAEHLRKLPMSFFNSRDLSDITTNMMADCASMESMLSSTIPPLIANVISVTLTCVCLAFFDWRMALALFATMPITFLIIWAGRNLQIRMFDRQVGIKLEASSQIQEYLEGIKIIKSCGLSGERFSTLNRALLAMKKVAIQAELVSGVLVQSAALILQASLGIAIFVGTVLITGGQIELLPLLVLLMFSTQLYGPTVLGENGSTLSGGERQRISIARALLKDAPIILLDEATASLDPENEVLIQRAIARLVEGKTVIMIAHRLRTVVDADQIFVLENGKLVERGTHDELIAHKGLYEKLYHIQQESLDWVV